MPRWKIRSKDEDIGEVRRRRDYCHEMKIAGQGQVHLMSRIIVAHVLLRGRTPRSGICQVRDEIRLCWKLIIIIINLIILPY